MQTQNETKQEQAALYDENEFRKEAEPTMACADLALSWLFISLDMVFSLNVAASFTTFSSWLLLRMSNFVALI